MIEIEDRLRALVDQEPGSDWLEAVAGRAQGGRAAPRRRRLPRAALVLGLLLLLAVGVLAVAVRRPTVGPTPGRSESSFAPTIAAAGRPVAMTREYGKVFGLPAGFSAQIIPSSVRVLGTAATASAPHAFLLRNGAACLAAQGNVDCATPGSGRHVLIGSPASGRRILLVSSDVRALAIASGASRVVVALHRGVGEAAWAGGDERIRVTLAGGSTVTEAPAMHATLPTPASSRAAGPGREPVAVMLVGAGSPGVLPAELERSHQGRPVTVRKLAGGVGVERDDVYAVVPRAAGGAGSYCISLVGHGDGTVESCGAGRTACYGAWLVARSMYPDYVVGVVSSVVRRAWVRLANGTRVEASLERGVLRADIPLERTGEGLRVLLLLADGRTVEEPAGGC